MGKPVGQAAIEAHSQGKVVYYTAKSTLVGTPIDASGQTELVGNYQTKAHVTLGTLDVAKPLAIVLSRAGCRLASNITGTDGCERAGRRFRPG